MPILSIRITLPKYNASTDASEILSSAHENNLEV